MLTMLVMCGFFPADGLSAECLLVPGGIALAAGFLAFSSLRRCACFLAGVLTAAVLTDGITIAILHVQSAYRGHSSEMLVTLLVPLYLLGLACVPVGFFLGRGLAKRFLPMPFLPRVTDRFRKRVFAPALLFVGAACVCGAIGWAVWG